MVDGYRITKHREYDYTFYHACDEEDPCGDIAVCHYCRYS